MSQSEPLAVGNRIREEREHQKMTQARLASRAGIKPQSLSSMERGDYLPSLETALRLGVALHTPLEALFWLGDPPARTRLHRQLDEALIRAIVGAMAAGLESDGRIQRLAASVRTVLEQEIASQVEARDKGFEG